MAPDVADIDDVSASQPSSLEKEEYAQTPPTTASAPALDTDQLEKIQLILSACETQSIDVLRELAASKDGLVTNENRRLAWPVLLGCQNNGESSDSFWASVERHQDEEQVQLDVNRAFVYYPRDESAKRTESRKESLTRLITTVLRRHPRLHYFQGYHDIVQVLMLVLGPEAAVTPVARLSLLRIRDFMLPTMAGTEPHLSLLPAILYAADSELYTHLSHTQPFFALAATLTLYAHDIEEYSKIARLFDFLLASDAVTPLYLYAAIVLSRKKELLEIDTDEPEMLHFTLSKLPKPLDLDGLIQRAVKLLNLHPPERLPGRAWHRISSHSVLKTTRDLIALQKQSVQDGERLFDRHVDEIARQDAWKRRQAQIRRITVRYRRPFVYTVTALLFGVLAVWLRSSGAQFSIANWLSSLLSYRRRTSELLRSVIGVG